MSATEIEANAGDLAQIGSVLDEAGSTLFALADDLAVDPDAGSSTDEVADALTALSTVVAGLAQSIGGLAEATGAVSTDFTATDQGVGARFDEGRG